MRDTFVCVVVVPERINIEIMLLTAHIRQRRRQYRLLRAAPDEEIAVLVSNVIHICSHRHIFACLHRLMVCQVTTQTHTVVETLLTESLVLKAADRARDIEIAYSSGVRSLSAVIQRQTRARVRVILIIIIYSHITADLRLGLQTRTLCTHIDHAVQRRRSVQHRRSTFDHLYLADILQRHVVPVDLTGLRIQNRHTVHQHLTTASDAIRPSSAAADRRLLVDDLHTRQRLQGSRQVRRSLTTQRLGFQHLHRDRHVRRALLKTTGGHHDVVQHLVMRQQRHIQHFRHRRYGTRLRIITYIRESQHRGLAGIYHNRVMSIEIRYRALRRIILVTYRHTDQRLARLEIGYYAGHLCHMRTRRLSPCAQSAHEHSNK